MANGQAVQFGNADKERMAREKVAFELHAQTEFVKRYANAIGKDAAEKKANAAQAVANFENEFRELLHTWGEVMSTPYRDTLAEAAQLGFAMSQHARQQPSVIIP